MKFGRIVFAAIFLAGGTAARATLISSIEAPEPSAMSTPLAETSPVMVDAGSEPGVDLAGVQASSAAVVVTPVAATPESASFLFLGTGLIGLTVVIRRSNARQQRSAPASGGEVTGALSEQAV